MTRHSAEPLPPATAPRAETATALRAPTSNGPRPATREPRPATGERPDHPAPPAGRPGPLRLVLDAIHAGVGNLTEVAQRTGLARDVAHAAVTHLVRTGYLRAEQLTMGCPDGGCGGCRDAATGCTATSARRSEYPGGPGPVLVTLARPRSRP